MPRIAVDKTGHYAVVTVFRQATKDDVGDNLVLNVYDFTHKSLADAAQRKIRKDAVDRGEIDRLLACRVRPIFRERSSR